MKFCLVFVISLLLGNIFAFADVVDMTVVNQYGWEQKIGQIYPGGDSVLSSGDNGRIVKISGKGADRNAYMFINSTAHVVVDGTTKKSTDNEVSINSITLCLNKETTEVVSVSLNEKGYLITFKEGGVLKTHLLNFNSEVFKKLLGDENIQVINNTYGIKYQYFSMR